MYKKRLLSAVVAALMAASALIMPMASTVDAYADTNTRLPDRFDLRDYGYVTPVKNQGLLGTCWGFAAIAAAETSILSELGLSYEQFREVYGYDLDLSENQLAWFVNTPIPSDGLVQNQIGEGFYKTHVKPGDKSVGRYDGGGYSFCASSVFANGIGPSFESLVPYKNKENTIVYKGVNDDYIVRDRYSEVPEGYVPYVYYNDGDWSVDEKYRFNTVMLLQDAKILNSPALKDGNGNYVYDPSATEAIKRELIEGRAVSVCIAADTSDFSQLNVKSKYISPNYAHYTYESTTPTHAVTIVGYDNSYAKENFLPNHQPPADGAWIVKNSWGAVTEAFPNNNKWGVNGSGYFYLSYYDRSIFDPECFDFKLSDTEVVNVSQYDYLPTTATFCLTSEAPASMANVFANDSTPQKLREVMIKTEKATLANVDIYILSPEAQTPTDGEKVCTLVQNFDVAGYHPVKFDKEVIIPANADYSVVVTEYTPYSEGVEEPHNCYAIQVGYDYGERTVEELKKLGIDPAELKFMYAKSVVNKDESFIYINGEWHDWSEYIKEVLNKAILPAPRALIFGNLAYDLGEMYVFDNFPIKVRSIDN